jgi:glutamate-ammonia-ligase adenylyltransferase
VASGPSERELLAAIVEELLTCASHSSSPDQALTYFERFARASLNRPQLLAYLRSSPQALEILIRTLGGSFYMAEILIRDPQLFYWVTDPSILHGPRRKREIQREILRTSRALASEPQQLDYLRSLKRREMLHIGVRDLLRLSSVEETWTALSVLAEALISAVHWSCAAALRREYDVKRTAFTGFTVLAMGKLGGGELNFSSDVDLMYLYASSQEEADGISAPEYFSRLSQKITAGLDNLTAEGYVYRVDLRLRPEGKAGNMADSLEGFRKYYETRIGPWERLALLKAWPVAGSPLLGRGFLGMAREFIYKRPFGLEDLKSVIQMKRRIDDKAASRKRGARNVKLGPGGIREIELITQAFQVCHGARLPQLHERNTIRALKSLRTESLLSEGEFETLTNAYVFLRDVENKLQMVQDAQTHWLPADEDELAACANLLGYRNRDGSGSPAGQFERDYERHTTQVNRLFEEILGSLNLERLRKEGN